MTPNSLLLEIQRTKPYIRSSTCSRQKILIVDKSENHVLLLAKFCNCCSMVWKHMQSQWNGNNLSGGGGKRLFVVLQSIFGHDFLPSRITIVSGIKNYPSACKSCCSNDLSLLLPDLGSLGSENVSYQEQIFASSWPKWHI